MLNETDKMIWIPFAGALSEATGVVLEKKVLRKKYINFKNYSVASFLAIVIAMLPLIYFFWRISPEAGELKNILIFAFVIASSVIANILIFYSLKKEQITEIEPIRLFQPLFVILIALVLYPSERIAHVIVPALIASSALVFSHLKRHHFQFNKHLMAAFFGSLFFAIELAASKSILLFYSEITFYFLRCLSVLIIVYLIFRPSFKGMNNKSKVLIFITGAIWVFYRLILYYGYLKYGVILTTLLFILAPVFIYLFAGVFLKEKLSWKNILATIVIIICVAYAIFFSV